MSEEKKKDGQIAKELSDLLDNALSDFSKETDKEEKAEKKTDEKSEEEADVGEEWINELVKSTLAQYEDKISGFLGSTQDGRPSEEQIQMSFQRMAEAAQQAILNPSEISDTACDFASTITRTLQGLNEGIENLEAPLSEQNLMNMFNPSAEGQNTFLPFMQGMMQSLLSKEVLYPSLKEILEKFPGWLQENDQKLSKEDKERFIKQKELMEEVCKELEGEKEDDSVDVRRTRFEKVLTLMQKLQDYGQPPADLVGDVGPDLQMGQLPNGEQCNLM